MAKKNFQKRAKLREQGFYTLFGSFLAITPRPPVFKI